MKGSASTWYGFFVVCSIHNTDGMDHDARCVHPILCWLSSNTRRPADTSVDHIIEEAEHSLESNPIVSPLIIDSRVLNRKEWDGLLAEGGRYAVMSMRCSLGGLLSICYVVKEEGWSEAR